MKTLFVLLPLILSACSTFEISRYSVSEYNNKAIVSKGIRDINIGSFTGYAFFNAGCKFEGPVAAADDMTFSTYIRRAFIAEFIKAHAFNSSSPTTITGRVNTLKFTPSTVDTTGSWDIAITLYSSNGRKQSFIEHYVFPSDTNSATACTKTANAFISAMQNLIAKTIDAPDSMFLVDNNPEKRDLVLADANSKLFPHQFFPATENNENH
jgi:hypothetical protein